MLIIQKDLGCPKVKSHQTKLTKLTFVKQQMFILPCRGNLAEILKNYVFIFLHAKQ